MTEVQRQRGGDGVAEAILHRDAEDRPRSAAAIEVVGKKMRRQGRQNVLHGAVFVEVPGDPERRERPDFVGVGNRAAENEDRQSPGGCSSPTAIARASVM